MTGDATAATARRYACGRVNLAGKKILVLGGGGLVGWILATEEQGARIKR